MNFKQNRLHILPEPRDLGALATTGVSLHCHTLHSKEILDFVPYYAEKSPFCRISGNANAAVISNAKAENCPTFPSATGRRR